MPLHDWRGLDNWDGFPHLWISELLYWIKPRLPAGHRAYIGTAPLLGIGATQGKPDVSVGRWPGVDVPPESPPPTEESSAADETPLIEVAVATLEKLSSLFIESRGFMVAGVELISPRNKDRPDARESSIRRYSGYLLQGVHLVLIDLHRHPLNFSYPNRIAADLGFTQPDCPAPCVVSYRVGDTAPTGGRVLAVWPKTLTIGEPLPETILPLNLYQSVKIDLEHTYMRAASAAYLE